jgi:hypothetical protein
MITSGQNTSILISSQLPGFVRDNPDYANFVLFLQAYYEWMEQNGGVTDGSKNLLNYDDIDTTTAQFIDYYTNEFLPYFPQGALVNKTLAVKAAKQLYQTKGTPASYEFLFRTLYNSPAEIFNTRDAILRASAGNWYITKSLKLQTNDQTWLYLVDQNKGGFRIFGETTQTIATIENATIDVTGKIEVFISNIERLFVSGEFVYVVDNANQPVYFNGNLLRAKIVGQISQINIDPNNRGLYYQPNDPIVLYGGLSSNTGLGAKAQVGTTTPGSILRVNVLQGGYGYQLNSNTVITVQDIPRANITLATIVPDPAQDANVSLIPADTITLSQYTTIGNARYSFFTANTAANANTTLANAFSFLSISTYPISSVLVNDGGSGITTVPKITAQSIINGTAGTSILSSLGILAPIQIISGGLGYQLNDVIRITGGTGLGANAKVTGVANGVIANVTYVTANNYPAGGLGYNPAYLPNATVVSSNVSAYGAVLSVPGILGAGAVFSSVTDRAGAISSITINDNGQDYIATPNVSFLVQDIVVQGVSINNITKAYDLVYQGSSVATATYKAYVDSIKLLQPNNDPSKSLYRLRVYNYSATPSATLPLKVSGTSISMTLYDAAYDPTYSSIGVKTYGDGTAKAAATFLNGLVVSQGNYLDSQGWPSGFNKLQSDVYNNYTYELTVEKEIAKYREVLLNLLHPSGMKVLGRYKLTAGNNFSTLTQEALYQGYPIQHYTGTVATAASMYADFTNASNNIIHFTNLSGANIANFIFTSNGILQITPPNGPNVRSQVISVDYANNNVTIADNTWLTFANVAYVTANSGSNVINISSLTGTYDIINNGNYSNTSYPLKDIVFAGDTVLIDNNTSKIVNSIDYINGRIYLTSNLTANANSLMAVNRTFSTNSVRVFGPLGTVYTPELTTESGVSLTTEDNNILLLG